MMVNNSMLKTPISQIRCPEKAQKMGVSHKNFLEINDPANLGYLHDYGNPLWSLPMGITMFDGSLGGHSYPMIPSGNLT